MSLFENHPTPWATSYYGAILDSNKTVIGQLQVDDESSNYDKGITKELVDFVNANQAKDVPTANQEPVIETPANVQTLNPKEFCFGFTSGYNFLRESYNPLMKLDDAVGLQSIQYILGFEQGLQSYLAEMSDVLSKVKENAIAG